jgi:Flp pilus assembly pilin Flp
MIRRHAGNNLMEYALPAGLIVVAVVAVVLQLPDLLQGVFRGSMNGAVQNGVLQVYNLGGDFVVSGPSANDSSLTLADGTVLDLPALSVSLSNSVETVGTDGTTTALAGQLQDIIEQLRAQGKTNEANQLADVADKILELARHQRGINQRLRSFQNTRPPEEVFTMFAQNRGQWHAFCQTSVPTCSSKQAFIQSLDGPQQKALGRAMLSDQMYEGKGLGVSYAQLLREMISAKDIPLLRDNPALDQYVSGLMDQVRGLHLSFSDNLTDFWANKALRTKDFNTRVVNAAARMDVPATTEGNGTRVCQTGGTDVQDGQCTR